MCHAGAGGVVYFHPLINNFWRRRLAPFLLNFWRLFVLIFVDFFYRIFFHSKAIGKENIPDKGGVLLASNHLSGWDVFLIPYFAFKRFSSREVWLPAKIELFSPLPVGLILRSMRVFPVKRGRANRETVKWMAEILKKQIMIIFPEGTRSKDGNLGKGKAGVGKLIYETKPTVVPTLVINTNYCMPPKSFFPNIFQKLYVVYGKPIDLSKYYEMEESKEVYRMIVGEVMAEIANLKEKHKKLNFAPKAIMKKVEAKQSEYLRRKEGSSDSG